MQISHTLTQPSVCYGRLPIHIASTFHQLWRSTRFQLTMQFYRFQMNAFDFDNKLK